MSVKIVENKQADEEDETWFARTYGDAQSDAQPPDSGDDGVQGFHGLTRESDSGLSKRVKNEKEAIQKTKQAILKLELCA